MTIEIVEFPIKNGDFHGYVKLPEGKGLGKPDQKKRKTVGLGKSDQKKKKGLGKSDGFKK